MNLQNLPTTNVKALIGIVLAITTVLWIVICDSIGHQINSANLDAVIGFVQIFIGISALQYVGKRATTKADVIAQEAQVSSPLSNHSYDPGA